MRYFLAIFALCVLATVGVLGFRGSHFRKPPLYIFPDMERQLKLRPQTANAFFANGMSSHLPVAGNDRAQPADPRRRQARLSLGGFAGHHRPHHGHHQFCGSQSAARHRRTARSAGSRCSTSTAPPATASWAMATASPNDRRHGGGGQPARQAHRRAGRRGIFNTVSYGKGLMQGYAANLPIQDRWAVVAYLRALQLSRLGSLDDVPEAVRGTLKK